MLRLECNFRRQDIRGKFMEVWRGGDWHAMNFFTIKKGCSRGGHYHKETRELFFIVEGQCEVKLRDIRTGRESQFTAGQEDVFVVDPYELHSLTALRESKVIALLSLPYDEKSPDLFTQVPPAKHP